MKRTVKYLYILFTISILVSCKKERQDSFGKPMQSSLELGKEIFEGKGTCMACHKPDVKVVGPSLRDIGRIYKEKKLSLVDFLKGNQGPVVDSTQFEIMKTNLALTKTFSDQELIALEQYIYSFSK